MSAGSHGPHRAVAVREDNASALVDQVHHPLHPREQEFLDVAQREQQPLLRSQVLGNVGECHLPRNLLVDAARVLVGEIEQLVQAVVHDVGIERHIHIRLLQTAQVRVRQERFRAAAAHGTVLVAFELAGNHRKVEPVRRGPRVVVLDLFHRVVLRQRIRHNLAIHAVAVIRVLVTAAVHIQARFDGRANVPRTNAQRPVNVQFFGDFVKRRASEVLHQLARRFIRTPIIHRDSIGLFAIQDCEPTFFRRHCLFHLPLLRVISISNRIYTSRNRNKTCKNNVHLVK